MTSKTTAKTDNDSDKDNFLMEVHPSEHTTDYTQVAINQAAEGSGLSRKRIVAMILNDWASNENSDSQWLRKKAAIAAQDKLDQEREWRETMMAIASLTSGIA